MTLRVPLFDTDFGQAEISAVSEVARSSWLTMVNLDHGFVQCFALRARAIQVLRYGGFPVRDDCA